MKKSTYTTLGKPAKDTSYSTLSNRWHAVSVVGGLAPCPHAMALRQQRFLSAEAPRLPLPDCTSPGRCQCRYQHFADRRAKMRRTEDRGGLPFPFAGANKRVTRVGRRAEDKEELLARPLIARR